jgi:hypothetical protein
MSENLIGLAVVVLFTGLIIGFALIDRRFPTEFRNIQGFEALGTAIERSVESGERVHLSLGSGRLAGSQGAPALAGLTVLRRIARVTALSDKPMVVSAGNGSLAILAQDTMQSAYRKANVEDRYEHTLGRMLGPSPLSYTAAMPSLLSDDDVAVNILMGSYTGEAALISEFATRDGAFVLAGSDDIPAQALLYASAEHPLVGEELFAAGAYLNMGAAHRASLRAEDVLRYIVVLPVILFAILKGLGVLG